LIFIFYLKKVEFCF